MALKSETKVAQVLGWPMWGAKTLCIFLFLPLLDPTEACMYPAAYLGCIALPQNPVAWNQLSHPDAV